jgi:hypothetical protein
MMDTNPNLMKTELQNELFASLFACLRPLSELMLRSGVSYRQFADISKLAFVEEAYAQIDNSDRRGQDSRVAAKTGISRKEIRRLRDLHPTEKYEGVWLGEDTFGAAARVLHHWHFDPKYLDQEGIPLELDFDVEGISFSSLVKSCAGDIPAGAVRTELLQAGALGELESGKLKVLKRFYIPSALDEKAISTISTILFPVTSGIAHNLDPNRSYGFLQRVAFSDSLNAVTLEKFRSWAREKAATFVEEVDAWLAENECELAQQSTEQTTKFEHASLGVFYYEGPKAGQSDRSGESTHSRSSASD